MPADDPAAYQQMSTEEIVKSLEDQLGSMDAEAAEIGLDVSGEEAPPMEGDAVDAEAEQALAEAEEVNPSDTDAESALGMVLSSGVTSPSEILDALRTQGFELIRAGGSPMEEMPEAAMEEEEMPFREARRKAAENAVGGTV